MKILKHTVLLLVTAAVIVTMLFIPDIMMNYMEDRTAATTTEEMTPVVLDLTCDLSYCRKAYIAYNGERYIASKSKEEYEKKEIAAKEICERIANRFADMCIYASSEYGDRVIDDYDIENSLSYLDKNLEYGSNLPMICVMNDTGEKVVVWRIFLKIGGFSFTLVIDDETNALLHANVEFDFEWAYLGDEALWLSSAVADVMFENCKKSDVYSDNYDQWTNNYMRTWFEVDDDREKAQFMLTVLTNVIDCSVVSIY